MLTGKNLLNELVDELNELKLSHMAVKLDSMYNTPGVVRQIKCCLKSQIKRCFFKRLPLWQVRLFGTETAHCFPLKNHHAKYMVVRA